MKRTNRHDQLRRRSIRDNATYVDPLSLPKLKELLALWKERYRTHEYPDDTCLQMIRIYETRIRRLEANHVE
jgi:hypothetical protein